MRRLLKKYYHQALGIKKRIRNSITPTAYILLYHRVADATNDPHQLSVSCKNFRDQIQYLKQNFKIIPLAKLVQDIRSRTVISNSMVITFDDGYADNLYNALPILKEFQLPATIFLTAGYIGQNEPFYWDNNSPAKDRGMPLTSREAKQLAMNNLIEIGAHTINHHKLAKLSIEKQRVEINSSKTKLRDMLDVPILSFAYPFGGRDSFDPTTIELVKKAGFHYACANVHERITKWSDIFALPRFIPRDWNADRLKQEIKKWI